MAIHSVTPATAAGTNSSRLGITTLNGSGVGPDVGDCVSDGPAARQAASRSNATRMLDGCRTWARTTDLSAIDGDVAEPIGVLVQRARHVPNGVAVEGAQQRHDGSVKRL